MAAGGSIRRAVNEENRIEDLRNLDSDEREKLRQFVLAESEKYGQEWTEEDINNEINRMINDISGNNKISYIGDLGFSILSALGVSRFMGKPLGRLFNTRVHDKLSGGMKDKAASLAKGVGIVAGIPIAQEVKKEVTSGKNEVTDWRMREHTQSDFDETKTKGIPEYLANVYGYTGSTDKPTPQKDIDKTRRKVEKQFAGLTENMANEIISDLKSDIAAAKKSGVIEQNEMKKILDKVYLRINSIKNIDSDTMSRLYDEIWDIAQKAED